MSSLTEEEMKKLKQTVDYFGHWYDVIGEERVAILEKAVDELEAAKALEKKYEKLLAFALERTECCDVCPQEVCENESGTCPYAANLKENEEKVTREWLEKFIEEQDQ